MKPNKGESAPQGKTLEVRSEELLDTEGMTQIAKAEQQGEIQAAAVIAKKFPRDEAKCRSELLATCQLSEFAGSIDDPSEPSAYYSFPRGRKFDKITELWVPNIVSGPSVKLAREATRIFGNIRYGFLITHDDDESRGITGWAWDLEKNLPIYGSDFFKKLIQRKQADGGTRWELADERELRELTFRRAAILIRNSLLALFPSYFINQMVRECKQTVGRAKSGESKTDLQERIERMVLAFSQYGISWDQLSTYLHKPKEEITDEDLADLRGTYEAIKDGMISPEERVDMFGSPLTQEKEPTNGLDESKFKSKDLPPTEAAPSNREKKETKKKTPPKATSKQAKPAASKPNAVTTESLLKEIKEATKGNFFEVKSQVQKKCRKGVDIILIAKTLNDQQKKFYPPDK